MPTTYAHWHFGDTVLKQLPEGMNTPAKKYRSLYDVGAQGPDVFFHYKALKSNDVVRYGTRMHRTPMRQILEGFKRNYPQTENREAATAYLLGFLSHFVLDSYCHGYIERKAEAEGPSHDRIEAQYDRHLLVKEGRDPYQSSITFSLKPSAFNARVMAQLYGDWDEKVMLRSARDQVFYRRLLRDSSDLKRAFLTGAMKMLGASKFEGVLMGKGEDPLCVTSNQRLDKLSDAAARHYPDLAENMLAYLKDDAAPDAYFDHHFGPKEDWKAIPLLSPEKEKEYRAEQQK